MTKANERDEEAEEPLKTDKEYKEVAKKRALAVHTLRTSKHKQVLKMVKE